ncbi:ABC transporter substrate-binding protein [Limisalsivibrio acetivorans]|uniref:ABC transporter substrate-binding protein n=1 Tax=Limisalsivibrio acetivorans TaxID=1304888 RepID=UPI0003B51668|nr:ABC transporter substrate-binding protein [Limisalsivibrio acetivorans]
MNFRTKTVKEIIDIFPETREVFVSNGFPQFTEDAKLESFGKFLKLETALKTKGYDIDTFENLLLERIEEIRNVADVTLKEARTGGSYNLSGLLPCPVRIPVLEKLDAFLEESDVKVDYKLEAASVGADWMAEDIRKADSADELSDVYLSAGFELFFGRRFRNLVKDDYRNLTDKPMNSDFDGLGLEDPEGVFSMVSVVPAVFMLNLEEQNGLPEPKRWSDLLKPEYEGKVSLPVGDFDLFNAILLNIYKEHGEEGVHALGRSMVSSMHPAEMVKNAGRKTEEKPFITIMPYFFTKMLMGVKSKKVVFPEDGAIVSPIFMLTRDKEDLKPLADAVFSKEIGEILSHRGLFPSLSEEVDNRLPEDARFKWIGWDYILENDTDAVIDRAMEAFNRTVGAA